mgnify:CR=1 FL=1
MWQLKVVMQNDLTVGCMIDSGEALDRTIIVTIGLRWVEAAAVKRMAAEDSPDSPQHTTHCSILLNRSDHIVTARRLESAVVPKQRGKSALVK